MTGEGYSRQPLSDEELAKLRHLQQHLLDNFHSPGELIRGLSPDDVGILARRLGVGLFYLAKKAILENKVAFGGVVSVLGYFNRETVWAVVQAISGALP